MISMFLLLLFSGSNVFVEAIIGSPKRNTITLFSFILADIVIYTFTASVVLIIVTMSFLKDAIMIVTNEL